MEDIREVSHVIAEAVSGKTDKPKAELARIVDEILDDTCGFCWTYYPDGRGFSCYCMADD